MIKTFNIKTTTNENISFDLDMSIPNYDYSRYAYVREQLNKACNTKVSLFANKLYFGERFDFNDSIVAGFVSKETYNTIENWCLSDLVFVD